MAPSYQPLTEPRVRDRLMALAGVERAHAPRPLRFWLSHRPASAQRLSSVLRAANVQRERRGAPAAVTEGVS